ncbi:hypothetical protein RPMA_02310 [Tardiphaga alba]|uniref:Tyr recombinase domain-containing protein n=1 Tax=Tardiphaga alba TaxID=340268 RepID=A0ABX8A605_9BRAD|nr:tyrosine-type recombinase/integrase [Tardiphaga alba]QUS37825.1 hypothetical protein RPMA_02310 [Tardiphaga alba]
MTFVQSELRRGGLSAAAAFPQVVDGEKPDHFNLFQRKSGIYVIRNHSVYVKSCKTRDKQKAEDAFMLFGMQTEARQEGIFDPRRTLCTDIMDYHVSQISGDATHALKNDTERLGRLRPHIEGMKLGALTGKVFAAIERRMRRTYAASVVHASRKAMRTAIRTWCNDHSAPLVLPFGPGKEPDGRDRVLEGFERDRVRRWSTGTENYDPETDTWSPGGPLSCIERNRREMVYRVLTLGLPTGTRGGKFAKMAWKRTAKFGHIDVGTGIMHRCSPGTKAPALKAAPAVLLSPVLLKEVRGWAERDAAARERYVFRRHDGEPAGDWLSDTFCQAMRDLGIEDVVVHTLRHTCITALIEQGVSASVISAIVGISVQSLRTRYNHSDSAAVQPLGHVHMDAVLTRH